MREAFINAPVAAVIFVATIGVSYYTLSKNPYILENLLLHPWRVMREKRYYMLVSHGFVHANFIHLLINMFVFYSFGFLLERILGHFDFFIIYMGSMIISGGVSVWKRQYDEDFRSLGASGAISGLVFSFILYFPNQTLLLFFILPMPAWIAGIAFVAGSYYAAKNGYLPGIDHEGHLWGAIAGAALTIFLEPRVIGIFFESLF